MFYVPNILSRSCFEMEKLPMAAVKDLGGFSFNFSYFSHVLVLKIFI